MPQDYSRHSIIPISGILRIRFMVSFKVLSHQKRIDKRHLFYNKHFGTPVAYVIHQAIKQFSKNS